MTEQFPRGWSFLVLCGLALIPTPSSGQQDVPRPHTVDVIPERPLKRPTTRELNQLEALKLYGQAVEHEHRSELPLAIKTYEKALRLDPEATAIRRALIPLYQALDRLPDAQDSCRELLDRAPDDFETWYLYARVLRTLDREAEARSALSKALACPGVQQKAELHLSIAYDLGNLCEKADLPKEAIVAFQQVAAILDQPEGLLEDGLITRDDVAEQNGETQERIGKLYLKLGQPDRAVAAFRLAQQREPQRAARLNLNLAEVLGTQKKYDEALRALDQYLLRQPREMDGYELKIRLLREARREADILDALEDHVAKDRHNEALRAILARECQKVGRLRQAEDLYASLLTTPRTEIYQGLFQVFGSEGQAGMVKLIDRLNESASRARPDDEKQSGDPTQAAHTRAMLSALRRDPALVKALLPVAHQRILNGMPLSYRLRLLLGSLAERTGQLEVAERLYRTCLDREGKVQAFGVRRQAEYEVYGGLLQVLALGRQHEKILEVCRQGLEHAEVTNRSLFYEHQGHAYLSLNRTKEALEAITTAADTASEQGRLYLKCKRGSFLAEMGRFDEAEKECQALFKEAKTPGEKQRIRFSLSSIYTLARKHDRAEEQLQAVLEDDPHDAHALNDLGYFWADRNKNLAEAERMIRRAVELDQQQRNSEDALGIDSDQANAAYLDSLGWVLYRRGKFQEARTELLRAASLPDGAEDPVVWDHLGDVHIRLNETKQAAAAWQKALQLYERGVRRKNDGRSKDIEAKLRLLDAPKDE